MNLWNAVRCASDAVRDPTPGALKARLVGSLSVHVSRSWIRPSQTSPMSTLTARDFHHGWKVSLKYQPTKYHQIVAPTESVSILSSQSARAPRAADSVVFNLSLERDLTRTGTISAARKSRVSVCSACMS